VFTLLIAWQLTPAGAQAPDPVKIGVQSLFDEVSADKIPSLLKSFEDLVKEMTGLRGKALRDGDAFQAAKDLESGKVHLALFQGYEFAWAKEKHAKLRPLMAAVYYDRDPRAVVLVQKASPAKSLADLKGKAAALPLSAG